MNIQLKQRLVGALVLVSLAVIIIPLLLPGEGSLIESQEGSRIPPEPDYRFAPPPEPPPAPQLAEAPSPLPDEVEPPTPATQPSPTEPPAAETQSAKPKAPATPATTQPDLSLDAATPQDTAVTKKGDGQATAWVVQVGSFSSDKNARALRDKLRKMGFTSFVEAVKDPRGRMVYRVRVGPELRRDLAERREKELATKAKLKGLVLRYP